MPQISMHAETIPSVDVASNSILFIVLQFSWLNHCPLICHLLSFHSNVQTLKKQKFMISYFQNTFYYLQQPDLGKKKKQTTPPKKQTHQ